MQFVIVSSEAASGDFNVSYVPFPLLLYTNCKNSDEFTKGIIQFQVDGDQTEFLEQKYCITTGQLVFCHYKSNEVAVMSSIVERIWTESCIYNIHRIHCIQWKDEWSFLKIIQKKILSFELPYKLHILNQVEYYAIPIADLKIPESIKNKLRFFTCILGINIAFKTDDGTIARRCNLFPTALLCSLNTHIKNKL
jgi:hypothetical protein